MNDTTYVNKEINKNPVWHIAWLLSEMRNLNAPIGWSVYIPDAELILEHYSVKLKKIKPKRSKP